MKPYTVTCSMNASISRAAELMGDFDVTALAVIDRAGMVVGIVTREDVQALCASSLSHRWVCNVMTAVAEACCASDPMNRAEAIMRKRNVARLPVSEDGTLVGVLLLEDISNAPRENPLPVAAE